MKNWFLGISTFSILFVAVLGCGMIDRLQNSAVGSGNTNSNKTLTDKVVDTAVGEQKIGVPECDQVVTMLTDYVNNPEDNFVVKAGKALFVNKIKESINQAVEQNKGDKAELAKNCKEFKTELEKYKAEEEKKKAQ